RSSARPGSTSPYARIPMNASKRVRIPKRAFGTCRGEGPTRKSSRKSTKRHLGKNVTMALLTPKQVYEDQIKLKNSVDQAKEKEKSENEKERKTKKREEK
ncbi:hypothetical protein J1N35_014978, partial [Gossypium stocksii]